MKLLFFTYIFLISSLISVRGEEAHYQISNLYHKRTSKFACEFTKLRINQIKKLREDELILEIESISRDLFNQVNVTNLQDKILHLKKLRDSKDRKNIILKGLRGICKAGSIIKYPLEGILFLNGAVINTLTLPISSIYQFSRGLRPQDLNISHLERTDFFYRAFGPKRGVETFLTQSVLYHTPSLLLGLSPVAIGLQSLLIAEMIVNYNCHLKDNLNEEIGNFCKSYQKMRDSFYKLSTKGFKLGQKVRARIDKRNNKKFKNYSPRKFCQLTKKKQVKRARSTLARAQKYKQIFKKFPSEIILPIHKNNCTKIQVSYIKETDIFEIENFGSHIEGIEIVTHKIGEFPKDYYFTKEEFNNMSPIKQICYDAEQIYYANRVTYKHKTYEDFFKVSLAPNMLSIPNTKKVTIESDNIRNIDIDQMKNFENVIFSIGHDNNQEYISTLFDEKKSLAKKLNKIFKKLVKSGSFEKCRNYINKKNISPDKLAVQFQRMGELNKNIPLQTYEEQIRLTKIFKKIKKKTKLKWRLIKTNDLKSVSKVIQSGKVKNIVFIGHGTKSGHFIDSKEQEFPKDLFELLPPSIMSLNFYSCYSKNLTSLYKIEENLRKSQSFYKIKYFSFVKENDFLNSDSYAPLNGFGDYLYQLDNYLNRSVKGAHLFQENFGYEFESYEKESQCKLDVSKIEIKKGSYSFSINNKFIGSSPANIIKFPCSILNNDTNKIKIKTVSTQEKSEIENLETFRVYIQEKELTTDHSIIRRNPLIIFKF